MSKTAYEIVWILGGSAPKEEIDFSLKNMSEIVEKNEGKVKSCEYWEQRTLAYPINDQEIGNYCVAKFEASSVGVKNIQKNVQSNQDIIRYLITKTD